MKQRHFSGFQKENGAWWKLYEMALLIGGGADHAGDCGVVYCGTLFSEVHGGTGEGLSEGPSG